VDEEMIRWCMLATRAACSRMTAPHLTALQDSVGQARSVPARFAWDRKATAHAQIFNLLADVITDRPVPALFLNRAVGAIYDLMVTVDGAAPAPAALHVAAGAQLRPRRHRRLNTVTMENDHEPGQAREH
jgi:hypothetical protein